VVRPIAAADVPTILSILRANSADSSLFQQPERQVRKTLHDFLLAVDQAGETVGCAALHRHSPSNAEILAVAVVPTVQKRGVGATLMRACIDRSVEQGVKFLWLATAKPDYFARFDFRPISRWSLPFLVLLTKLRLVFQQPLARWLPALLGRHTFMRWTP
jgi:amino-acid N-acetyltransferase